VTTGVFAELSVRRRIEDPFGHHSEIGKPLGDRPPARAGQ
jgi:hypothetical protein